MLCEWLLDHIARGVMKGRDGCVWNLGFGLDICVSLVIVSTVCQTKKEAERDRDERGF